ncbi:MAG: hypothetical protein ABUL46_03655 [Chitinophaga rupis]
MKSLILPLFCFAFCGCGHQCACNLTNIDLSFTGYNTTEIDSIKIIKFQAGSQFATPIDSVLLTSGNSYSTQHNMDTLDFYAALGNNNFTIANGYDWEIINLSDNKLTRISDIQVSPKTMHCGGIQLVLNDKYCFSPITSFAADGIVIHPVNPAGEARYYISK